MIRVVRRGHPPPARPLPWPAGWCRSPLVRKRRKRSFGLLPRTAMLKTTDTLDSVGLFARSIDDIELLFEVCRVRGHNYPVSDAILTDASRQTVSGRPLRIA